MIRHTIGQTFRLITQIDHAAFSGQMAQRIGNEQFAAPSPFASTVAAVANHDAGWVLHDEEPTLNSERLPRHVFEMPLGLSLRIWSESARLACAIDPYCGLLVSLHQFSLSAVIGQHLRASTEGRAPTPQTMGDAFEVNKFQHAQADLEQRLRTQLGFATNIPVQLGLARAHASDVEDAVRFNYALLAVLDRISLALCCGKELFHQIDQVPPRPGAAEISLHLRYHGATLLDVAPWPFDAGELRFSVPCRYIAAGAYADEADYQAAYAAARVEAAEFTLKAG